MSYDMEKIRTAILDSLIDSGNTSPELRQAIVFHMTDWLDDLVVFNQFCENPSRFNSEEVHHILHRFLTHVPNHLAAASKLFLDIPVTDIFQVGSTSEE